MSDFGWNLDRILAGAADRDIGTGSARLGREWSWGSAGGGAGAWAMPYGFGKVRLRFETWMLLAQGFCLHSKLGFLVAGLGLSHSHLSPD